MPLPSVLLIDDNPADNFIHTRQIVDMGLVPGDDCVFVKENGREALEFFRNYELQRAELDGRFPPKLVLLDINMPLMNGFEFLERYEKLAEDPRYDSIILLMLTSSDNPQDKQRANAFRCLSGYLTKPVTQEKLRRVLEEYF